MVSCFLLVINTVELVLILLHYMYIYMQGSKPVRANSTSAALTDIPLYNLKKPKVENEA